MRGGLAPETRGAFFQLAASKTFIRNVDTRQLAVKGMTVRAAASTTGSLATGLVYDIRWSPNLSAGHSQPLPLIGWLDCYQYDAHRALLAEEVPGLQRITIAEDGKTVVSNSPMARDPLQPATRFYAFFIPQTVKTVTINGGSFSLQDCENRD